MKSEILEDLEKRGVTVSAFIVRNEAGQFQLLSYTNEGVVQFLSEFVDVMDINERLKGSMISPLATIGEKK